MSRRVLQAQVSPAPPRNDYYSQRLNDLTDVLSDTNENLHALDKEIYRNKPMYERGREEYYRRSNIKQSYSDTEDEYYHQTSPNRGRPARRGNHNVVFRDDLNESLHELHQQVRDLSFDHEKLSAEVNRIQDNAPQPLEKRMEKRFANVYDQMKKGKGEHDLRSEIKSTLDEFRKVTKEDMAQLKLAMTEADKQKVQNELQDTKQRLNEIEDSKHSLSTQVQQLRDQLMKYESGTKNASHYSGCISEIGGKNNGCKCCIEKEIETLKADIKKTKEQESASEIMRALEKYEKQKDSLSEHNQALKKLLGEKENREHQLAVEVKLLHEKNDHLEKHGSKVQIDLELALAKLQEITQEAEKYANALRSVEEQLHLSEMKRNELKMDAQETVKLWKNKVKKLEKGLEKYRADYTEVSEQNEHLKNHQNNYSIQLESKNQENLNLKDLNASLNDRLNLKEIEMNHLKNLCDEVRNQNESMKSELNEGRVNCKQYENRLYNVQTEKADLERHLLIESEKYRDILDKTNITEFEMKKTNNERQNLLAYISKLESECKRMRSTLDNLERIENVTKTDLSNVSTQALQNKESYDERINKVTKQYQKSQFQLQKVKMECEDSIRLMHVQLAEEKSKLELFKKRENDYLKDIDELKDAKRKVEDELIELQTAFEKLARNDNDKNKQIMDFEERINKLINDISDQKNVYYNKESDYWQILNTINIDVDVITGLLSTNSNDIYKPLAIIDDTEKDKAKSFYALIKSKLHWVGKEVEAKLQKECKLQQTLKFLQHDVDNKRKNSGNSGNL